MRKRNPNHIRYPRWPLWLTGVFCLVLFAGCTSPPPEPPFPKDSELTVWVITDTHYREWDPNDENASSGAKLTEYLPDILLSLQRDISIHKPDVLLVTGDITDTGADYARRDMAALFTDIEALGTIVLAMPGNHDVASDSFAEIFSEFGYKDAYMRSGYSYVTRLTSSLWVISLDSGFYGQLEDDTLTFFDKTAEAAQKANAQLVVAVHHNSVAHIPAMNDGFVLYPQDKFSEIMQTYNLPLTLSGHMHAQDIASYRSDGYSYTDIATGAMTVYPHRYGELVLSPDRWEYNTKDVNVVDYAKENDPKYKIDPALMPNLLNFPEFSRDYYTNRFRNNTDLTDAARELRSRINLHYFEGDENQYYDELKDHPGWADIAGTRFESFMRDALYDDDLEDNHWAIALD